MPSTWRHISKAIQQFIDVYLWMRSYRANTSFLMVGTANVAFEGDAKQYMGIKGDR